MQDNAAVYKHVLKEIRKLFFVLRHKMTKVAPLSEDVSSTLKLCQNIQVAPSFCHIIHVGIYCIFVLNILLLIKRKSHFCKTISCTHSYYIPTSIGNMLPAHNYECKKNSHKVVPSFP